jgi:hypothetical protein
MTRSLQAFELSFASRRPIIAPLTRISGGIGGKNSFLLSRVFGFPGGFRERIGQCDCLVTEEEEKGDRSDQEGVEILRRRQAPGEAPVLALEDLGNGARMMLT